MATTFFVDESTDEATLLPRAGLSTPSLKELVLWGFNALGHLARHYTECRGADTEPQYTYFHSAAEPGISVADYAQRLDRHLDIGDDGMLLTLILIGRYSAATGLLPSTLSVHRLVLAAARVVTKATQDLSRSCKTFAKVGGIDVSELVGLEACFLDCISFSAFFSFKEYHSLITTLTLSRAAPTFEEALALAAPGLQLPVPIHHAPFVDFGAAASLSSAESSPRSLGQLLNEHSVAALLNSANASPEAP